jgi:GTP-binding protein
MQLHVLLTKADKLKRGPAQSTLLNLRKELRARLGDAVTVQTFSALKKTGVEQLQERLNGWLQYDSIDAEAAADESYDGDADTLDVGDN